MTKQRQNSFAALTQDHCFDVVILGGGINGIGVFRELAMQGLRVLLVERGDFCSGCSAAPSRMIHGGLRYLENGEFDLVRESLAERDALLRNAPHFVRPLPTTIPITSWFSGTLNAAASFFGLSGKPARRGALPIKFGLALYDLVTRKNRQLPRHIFHGARATKQRWPVLPADVTCSATYYDAWISHPERLGVELILDATAANPDALALNYAELALKGDALHVTNLHSGQTYPVRAKTIVNATGAWLDKTIDALTPGTEPATPLVSGTKGSHLILDNPALFDALDGHMIFFENEDGRICIVFPYLGRVLAGSTDIRVDTPRRVRCDEDERDYILGSLRMVFPQTPISADQILFSYSGIRPLPRSDQDFTGRISRGHSIKRIDGHIPQFCMVGGKWTTFRAFAEQVADKVLLELGKRRLTSTKDMAIGGGKGFRAMAETGKGRPTHLIENYGSRAEDVLRYCAALDGDAPLVQGTHYSTGEIAFLAEHEHALNLSDIVLRRTTLAITGQISADLIDAVAAVMAKTHGWSDAQQNSQRKAVCDELAEFHGVTVQTLQSRNTKG